MCRVGVRPDYAVRSLHETVGGRDADRISAETTVVWEGDPARRGGIGVEYKRAVGRVQRNSGIAGGGHSFPSPLEGEGKLDAVERGRGVLPNNPSPRTVLSDRATLSLKGGG